MPTLIDRELYPADDSDYAPRPRTVSVLTVLMVTAVVLSYLVSYALPHALVAANAMQPWPAYADPRPRWMVLCFTVLLSTFVVLMGIFYLLNALQVRRIDSMVEDQ